MRLRTLFTILAFSLFLNTATFLNTAAFAQAPPDAIDFGTVTILNSPDEVRHWPATSTLTALGLRPSSLHLEHTKQGLWPPVPYGDTTQESTLWIFLRTNGQWLGAGVERIRPGQHDKPEGAPSQQQADWFYDPNRWPGMVQPRPGDVVGYMVAAGDTRGGGNILVRERSNIVLVAFPTDAGRDYPPFEGSVVVPPVPPVPPVVNPPTPTPTPAPVPAPLPAVDYSELLSRIITLQEQQLALARDTHDHVVNIDKTIGETIGEFAKWAGKYVLPAIAAFVAARQLP